VKYLLLIAGLAGAATVATYVRYESLNPCDWLVRDGTSQSGLPALAEEARIRAAFLLRGIAEPGPTDCLEAWWRLRSEGTGQAQ
jgi:hypothetical protein